MPLTQQEVASSERTPYNNKKIRMLGRGDQGGLGGTNKVAWTLHLITLTLELSRHQQTAQGHVIGEDRTYAGNLNRPLPKPHIRP